MVLIYYRMSQMVTYGPENIWISFTVYIFQTVALTHFSNYSRNTTFKEQEASLYSFYAARELFQFYFAVI